MLALFLLHLCGPPSVSDRGERDRAHLEKLFFGNNDDIGYLHLFYLSILQMWQFADLWCAYPIFFLFVDLKVPHVRKINTFPPFKCSIQCSYSNLYIKNCLKRRLLGLFWDRVVCNFVCRQRCKYIKAYRRKFTYIYRNSAVECAYEVKI